MPSPVEVGYKYLSVREQPKGSNRAPEIDAWLKAVGAPLGSPWCAAFVYHALVTGGVTPPKRSGRVQDWVDAVGVDTLLPSSKAREGDVLVFWFKSLNRYAHIGLCTGRDGKAILTLEGNTIPTGFTGDSREGFGVFEHRLNPSPNLKVLRLT